MKPVFNSIKITLTDETSLYSCKVGGDFISDTPPGAFLAQINLAEIPWHLFELPQNRLYMPIKGWLQFFIGDDPELGLNWPDRKGGTVRYLPELVGEVHQSNYENTPVVKECGMSFEPAYEHMSTEDYRFQQTERWQNATDEEREGLYVKYYGGGSKLLGYPSFSQYDPREKSELQKYDTLLFQLDSERGKVMWGDMGVGNFFIPHEKLENWDFSDVLYTWDCC